jgi:hypothetical protein
MTPDDPSNLPLATDLNYDPNPTPFPTPPIPTPPHPTPPDPEPPSGITSPRAIWASVTPCPRTYRSNCMLSASLIAY